MSILKKIFGSKELPLCKCGCGKQVEKKTKKYFEDHFRNPPSKEEHIVEAGDNYVEPEDEKKIVKSEKKNTSPTKKTAKSAKLSRMPKIRKASSADREAKRKLLLKNMGGSNSYLSR